MTRKTGGFTLVEMLAALVAASMLVGIVYGTVRIGQRSASSVDVNAEAAEVRRIGWEFVREAISSARAIPNPDDDDDRTSFRGTNDGLSFVADMRAGALQGGLLRIDISIGRSDGKQPLVVGVRPFRIREDTASPDYSETAELVQDVEWMRIAYLTRGEEQVDNTWKTEWLETDSLPLLVNFAVKPVGSTVWPLVTARPSGGGLPLGLVDLDDEGSNAEAEAEEDLQQDDH